MTFTSKEDEHVAEQVSAKEISSSTQNEPTASIGSEVSPFPMILSEQTSCESKEASILLSDKATMLVKLDPGPSRPKAGNINVS